MNHIIYAKQDLTTFSYSDLLSLARYLELDTNLDHCDLAWLIALKLHGNKHQYAEMPIPTEIWSKKSNEVLKKLDDPSANPDDIYPQFLNADPSDKRYTFNGL